MFLNLETRKLVKEDVVKVKFMLIVDRKSRIFLNCYTKITKFTHQTFDNSHTLLGSKLDI